MTCIIGFLEPKTKKVYIGGDSAGVAGHSITVRADKKVFRNGDFLMGFTSSFRMGQILQYDFHPPAFPEGQEDIMKYMVSSFIKDLRGCMTSAGFAEKENNVESCGLFLVGYKNRLFKISSDYQVGESIDGIDAVGCGQDLALGAMYALEGLDPPEERIRRSLEITEKLNGGVRGPFSIISS